MTKQSSDDWLREAKCVQQGHPWSISNPQRRAEFFYPDDGPGSTLAKNFCRGRGKYEGTGQCPVLMKCLEHSLLLREILGIWGGHGQRERVRARKIWEKTGRLVDVVAMDEAEVRVRTPSSRKVS